jgi:hypothetical protein
MFPAGRRERNRPGVSARPAHQLHLSHLSLLPQFAGYKGTNMNANIEAVKSAYAAFGKGDIPGVLEILSPEVEWTIVGPPSVIPYAGHHKGRGHRPRNFERDEFVWPKVIFRCAAFGA